MSPAASCYISVNICKIHVCQSASLFICPMQQKVTSSFGDKVWRTNGNIGGTWLYLGSHLCYLVHFDIFMAHFGTFWYTMSA